MPATPSSRCEMQFMCSKVRPSRSACLRAALVNCSMSPAPTTRPSIRVSAVNVADFSRPHATATTTSSNDSPCRALGLRHGFAHSLLGLVQLEHRAALEAARSTHAGTQHPHAQLPEAHRRLHLGYGDDDADGLAGADVQQADDAIGLPACSET